MSSDLKPGWSYKNLNELGFVGRGRSRHRPRNAPSLYGGPYPFIQTAEIKTDDLGFYGGFKLINAMLDFESQPLMKMNAIII